MLETLNRYIEERSADDGPLTASWGVYGRDRRFPTILMLSLTGHIIFYVVMLQLDWWVLKQIESNRKQEVALVKVAELAPPLEQLPLRPPPDQVEQADIKKMEFEPDRADDVNLISRSKNPGEVRESPALPAPPKPQATASPAAPPPSSAIAPIDRNRLPVPDAPVIAQANPSTNAPTPVAPSTNATAAPASAQGQPQGSAQRGEGDGAKTLGLEAAQSQYMAYVRKKISDANERIMPRGFIEGLLTKRVSALFKLQLGRGGRVLKATLLRSSGYSSLDNTARDAIFNARPFNGYPPNAGDEITLEVEVHYHPWR